MELEISLLCSQGYAIGSYFEPDKSNPLPQTLFLDTF